MRRAEAWDDHLARVQLQEQEAAVEREAAEWAERESWLRRKRFELGKASLERAETMLRFPLERQVLEQEGRVVHVHPAKWSLHSAARLLVTGDLLCRAAINNSDMPQADVREEYDFQIVPYEPPAHANSG